MPLPPMRTRLDTACEQAQSAEDMRECPLSLAAVERAQTPEGRVIFEEQAGLLWLEKRQAAELGWSASAVVIQAIAEYFGKRRRAA